MRSLILLLASAALIGAAPARHAPRFHADGFEPGWVLEIENGRMTYNPGTTEPILRMREPRRRPMRGGYRYVTPRLTVEVYTRHCESYSGQHFTHEVNVTFDGNFHDGCGGTLLPPPSLSATSWSIVAVDGRRINRDSNQLSFEYTGRTVTGSFGCSNFSGPYRERRPALTIGRLNVTRHDCEYRYPLGAALERRAMQILSGNLRMRFYDGDSLELTGRGGSLRMVH